LRKSQALSSYLNRIFTIAIENQDALDVLKRWDSPQTLFYCDPPYPETDQGGYLTKTYTNKDFQALVDFLNSCQGSFILSCYSNVRDISEISIPESWECVEVKSRMRIRNYDKSLDMDRTNL
jgi:DNA adenine methylase